MNWRKIKALRIKAENKIEEGRGMLIGLRGICQHLHKTQGLYSWRIGVIEPAIICDDCGECISIISSQQNTMISTQNDAVSDTTEVDSSNAADKQKIQSND